MHSLWILGQVWSAEYLETGFINVGLRITSVMTWLCLSELAELDQLELFLVMECEVFLLALYECARKCHLQSVRFGFVVIVKLIESIHQSAISETVLHRNMLYTATTNQAI